MDAYQHGLQSLNTTMKYDGLKRIKFLKTIVSQMWPDDYQPKVIRVCGTNGKGSTIKMVNNVLLAGNYSSGLFTSPYLLSPLEQIQINGKQITKQQFVAAEQEVMDVCQSLAINFTDQVSEFESWFLIALKLFINSRVKMVLLECGMGGELDATNAILDSNYSLFTRIGLDHFKFLGNTLEKIATTKVRMIRKGETVISYPHQRPIVQQILQQESQKKAAQLVVGKQKVSILSSSSSTSVVKWDNYPAFRFNLVGKDQLENLQIVLTWWQKFNQQNLSISFAALVKGIEETKLMGRFNSEHGWILDGAHNRDAIANFVQTVNHYYLNVPKVIIVGFLADKEVERCVKNLQELHQTVFLTVTPDQHERALSSKDLSNVFKAIPSANQVRDAENIGHALKIANQDPQAVKLVVGSFYTVKAFLENERG